MNQEVYIYKLRSEDGHTIHAIIKILKTLSINHRPCGNQMYLSSFRWEEFQADLR